jgi:hypothetical protein
MSADPKSPKRRSGHQCLFAILGSAFKKAACEMLVKLTQGINPTKLFSSLMHIFLVFVIKQVHFTVNALFYLIF